MFIVDVPVIQTELAFMLFATQGDVTSLLQQRARHMRHNQTVAEAKMWAVLRNQQLGCKFRRQHVIACYIVDFVCLERALIVEIDGGQHTMDTDRERTVYLEGQGFRMLRFWNDEVLGNMDGVHDVLLGVLGLPSPRPSPSGEGE